MDAEEIIGKNLRLMRSTEPGGMVELLCKESIGGNAGSNKACTNFLYYASTEEISVFTNNCNINKPGSIEGYFKIYAGFNGGENIIFGQIIKKESKYGNGLILEECIDRHNLHILEKGKEAEKKQNIKKLGLFERTINYFRRSKK